MCEENELMVRIQAGDLLAFESLVKRYQFMVYGLAMSILRRPEDAEEAAQDTFLKLFRARDQFDVSRKLEPWLLQIAGNVCRDHRRRVHVEAKLGVHDNAAEGWIEQISDERSVENSNHSHINIIHNELAHMNAKLRLPMELKYLRGMRHAQIALVLGISVSSVKVQIARATDLLQNRLQRLTGT
ncbi:MAG: sigma-70 family RNA polymerase sigma factor [Planctomycetes bacterium]|nr:sigma-70 family RNA polymerase sigma factor [Planctomycetota bacterium]